MAATPRKPSSMGRCFLESLKDEAEVDVILFRLLDEPDE
jgi:hypothetical protein